MYAILKGKAGGMQDETVAFAADLVRIASPSLAEQRAADRVQKEMGELGFDRVHRDETGNVVGILFGRDSGPNVVLNSHLDTVAAGSTAGWSEDPCSGRLSDGRLYGLGAADCKGGLAAQVYAGALLKRSLLPLRGNLVVAATVAEENGCSVGVRALLDQTLPALGIRPDYAVLGEPTRLGLYYGHDGWLEANVTVESADPFAVKDAAQLICRELGGRPAAGSAAEETTVAAPVFLDAGGMRKATIRVARRLRPGQAVAGAVDAMRYEVGQLARPAPALALNVALAEDRQELYTGRTTVVRRVAHAWSTDPFHPLMERSRQALAAAGCLVRPGRWELGRLGMGTAGNQFVAEFDVPTIGYGPGDEEQAHRPNESVAVGDLLEAVYGTAAIVHSLIGIPVCGWTADSI